MSTFSTRLLRALAGALAIAALAASPASALPAEKVQGPRPGLCRDRRRRCHGAAAAHRSRRLDAVEPPPAGRCRQLNTATDATTQEDRARMTIKERALHSFVEESGRREAAARRSAGPRPRPRSRRLSSPSWQIGRERRTRNAHLRSSAGPTVPLARQLLTRGDRTRAPDPSVAFPRLYSAGGVQPPESGSPIRSPKRSSSSGTVSGRISRP